MQPRAGSLQVSVRELRNVDPARLFLIAGTATLAGSRGVWQVAKLEDAGGFKATAGFYCRLRVGSL